MSCIKTNQCIKANLKLCIKANLKIIVQLSVRLSMRTHKILSYVVLTRKRCRKLFNLEPHITSTF